MAYGDRLRTAGRLLKMLTPRVARVSILIILVADEHGVRLADPHGLLNGDRVSKRFVPIETSADAERPEVAALIREAGAFDPRGTTCVG